MNIITKLVRAIWITALVFACAADVVAEWLPFTEPLGVGTAVNTEGAEFGGSMTGDRLQIFFCGSRPGSPGGPVLGTDVMCATRDDPDTPFDDVDAVRLVGEVSTGLDETFPFVSADGTALFFTRDLNNNTIWVATREDPDPESPFDRVEPLLNLDMPGIEIMGSVSCDGTKLFFAHGPGAELGAARYGIDLWVATRAEEDLDDPFAFSDPRPVPEFGQFGPEMNSEFDENSPALDSLGVLFFTGWPSSWGIDQRPGGRSSDVEQMTEILPSHYIIALGTVL